VSIGKVKKKNSEFHAGFFFYFCGHLVFKFGGGQIARRIEQDMSPMKNVTELIKQTTKLSSGI
jgi:hypothetical protein